RPEPRPLLKPPPVSEPPEPSWPPIWPPPRPLPPMPVEERPPPDWLSGPRFPKRLPDCPQTVSPSGPSSRQATGRRIREMRICRRFIVATPVGPEIGGRRKRTRARTARVLKIKVLSPIGPSDLFIGLQPRVLRLPLFRPLLPGSHELLRRLKLGGSEVRARRHAESLVLLRRQFLPAHVVGQVPDGGLRGHLIDLPGPEELEGLLKNRIVGVAFERNDRVGHAGLRIGLAVGEANALQGD